MPIGARPPIPVHCARIALEGQFGNTGHPWANVFHVYLPGETATASDWGDYLDTFAVDWTNRMFPHVENTVQLQLIRGSLRQSTTTTLVRERGRTDTGTGGLEVTTQQACVVLSWSTLESYRGGRMRTYVPGVPYTALQNSGLLSGAYASAVGSAADGFMTDVADNTPANIPVSILGVVHFQRDDTWLSPTTFEQAIGVHVRRNVRTQRRRIEP